MSLFETIVDKFGGSIIGSVLDAVKSYWPPDVSPEKKAQFQEDMMKLDIERQKMLLTEAHNMAAEFNQQIKDLEGTATDLRSVPFLGNIMLFLRGAQRPIWGFATIYLDFMVYSKTWPIESGSQQAVGFVIINVLVLGFLFGERAVQNVIPYITQYFQGKK